MPSHETQEAGLDTNPQNPGELLVATFQERDRLDHVRGVINGVISGINIDQKQQVTEGGQFIYWADTSPEIRTLAEDLGIEVSSQSDSDFSMLRTTVLGLGRNALNLEATNVLVEATRRQVNDADRRSKDLMESMKGKAVRIEAINDGRPPIYATNVDSNRRYSIRFPKVVEGTFTHGVVSLNALIANLTRSRFGFRSSINYNIEVTDKGQPQVAITVLD